MSGFGKALQNGLLNLSRNGFRNVDLPRLAYALELVDGHAFGNYEREHFDGDGLGFHLRFLHGRLFAFDPVDSVSLELLPIGKG